ncbi:MAG: hypothetical protein RR824_09495, partial [Clostridia bacterium]
NLAMGIGQIWNFRLRKVSWRQLLKIVDMGMVKICGVAWVGGVCFGVVYGDLLGKKGSERG